jgi:hypothetical protein
MNKNAEFTDDQKKPDFIVSEYSENLGKQAHHLGV